MSDAPRRGRVPNDLRRRLDEVCRNAGDIIVASRVAATLEGRSPAWFRGARLHLLKDQVDGGVWDLPELEHALDLLEQVGYGEPRTKPRVDRSHGTRLQDRLDGVLGQLPRALALRYPTTDDRHATGPVTGLDRYGPVTVNHTARDGHLGLIAAAMGLWRQRARQGEQHVDVTRGELAYLLRAGRRESQRTGGGDTEWISRLLSDLHVEEITAAMDDRRRRKRDEHRPHSTQHAIPASAIARVEARWHGEWLPLPEYQRLRREHGRGGPGSGQVDTVRIHIAPWALAAIAEDRPVYVNFAVWRGLSGTGRRLYAFLQGSTASKGLIAFYLAAPMRFTLGLYGARLDKTATLVRHQLRELYHRDQRYHHQRTDIASGFRQLRRHEDGLPLFHVYAQEGRQSLPLAGVRVHGPTARRPLCLRPAGRPSVRVSPHDIRPQDIPTDLKRQRGFQDARAYVAKIRELGAASRPPRRDWAQPPPDTP
jgi:hypothetical protein